MRHVKYIYLLVLYITSILCMHAIQPPPLLISYFNDLMAYQPNAPWIIEACTAMTIEELSAAWSALALLLKEGRQQGKFFYEPMRPHTTVEDSMSKYAWQCRFLDLWLNRLYSNKITHLLVYDRELSLKDNMLYEPVLQYWRVHEHQAYYEFYAFYADCLSYLFLQGVQYAYCTLDDGIQEESWAQPFWVLEELKKAVNHLKQSRYETRYSAQLERYLQLHDLLENEKIEALFN